MDSLWKLGDEFRGHSKVSEDHQWSVITSKLAELTRSKGERINNFDYPRNIVESKPWEKMGFQEDSNFETFTLGLMNYGNINGSRDANNNSNNINTSTNINLINGNNNNSSSAVDKRFKTLPSTEMLPRNEILGGYIFVCNNDTMQEDLKRQLFGLPPRYRDSVRAITPGLPLFLYNYTTHQLHGIFEASSFGGSNIDPTAWEDKKCKGESRFPAQVRIRVRKLCKPLEEDAFRPVLHHYDGPKFRLELSIAEVL
ncbi:hypothetical protein KSP40_PGU011121 [Platanthera guangdongensis]|uniref:DCD domain-containing protein n=1 Tax=Platanthera guangdongensis TaxID=2320717 RepID=A0ABR2MWK3_9ASPA